MDKQARVAFVMAQSACANADIQGMVAENKQREIEGKSMAYDHAAFLAVQDQYLIGHNAVIVYLRD